MPSFFKNQKSKSKLQPQTDQTNSEQTASSLKNLLAENLTVIKEKTGNSSDIVIRHFKIGVNNSLAAAIVYIEGIVDNQAIQDYLLQSLMKDNQKNDLNDQNALELISEDIVTIGNVSFADNWNDLLSSLMSGDSLLIVDGINRVLSVSTQGGEKRAIAESTTQMVVRGPKGAFTESIGTNLAMVAELLKHLTYG